MLRGCLLVLAEGAAMADSERLLRMHSNGLARHRGRTYAVSTRVFATARSNGIAIAILQVPG